jgi:N6-adenosine-specific RNA methylase IME4
MYLTYDTQFEGAGAQYQRILCLLAIAKRHNLKYIHKKITVDHNYNNDSEWDNKWDDFFNISTLSYHGNIEKLNIVKYEYIDNTILNKIINAYEYNNLYSICFAFNIVDTSPDYYYKSIQDDAIYAYDKANSNRQLMYSKDKISIALHIRAYNDCDETHVQTFEHTRFAISCDEYYKLITKLKNTYTNAEIHIFSQKTFDEKYSSLRDIPDLNIHLDYDTFDTFHHLCKADILVMGRSSFSYLAAIYNKKSVIYYTFWHPPLDNWVNFKNFI